MAKGSFYCNSCRAWHGFGVTCTSGAGSGTAKVELNAKIRVPEGGLDAFGFIHRVYEVPDASNGSADHRKGTPCSADTSSNSWACWL